MENTTKNLTMTKESNMHTKLYVSKIMFILFIVLLITPIASTNSIAEDDLIRAKVIKDQVTLDLLVKATKKMISAESDVENEQIVKVNYSKEQYIYIVPVIANEGQDRGCYLYCFDHKLQFMQKIILSKLEEVESCEIIRAIFSCNRVKKQTSGIGVLYGKRLGADHYWFEGSYLTVDHAGKLKEDEQLSARLSDIDTVSKAKKKLTCQ